MNRWQLHVKEWSNCTRCELHKNRSNVVLLRGTIPCDVLFIGEAPGDSENDFGIPFYGEAGDLLQFQIIDVAVPGNVAYALSNLLGCIPLDSNLVKADELEDKWVRTCSPRLIDLVDFCSPKMIVCIGKYSKDYLAPQYLHRIKIDPKNRVIPRINIVHPSWILRQPIESRPKHTKIAALAIREGIREHVLNSKG